MSRSSPAETIRKLEALANDKAAQPGERDNAKKKAQELRAKHNIKGKIPDPTEQPNFDPFRQARDARSRQNPFNGGIREETFSHWSDRNFEEWMKLFEESMKDAEKRRRAYFNNAHDPFRRARVTNEKEEPSPSSSFDYCQQIRDSLAEIMKGATRNRNNLGRATRRRDVQTILTTIQKNAEELERSLGELEDLTGERYNYGFR